jgi:hypothetical protein
MKRRLAPSIAVAAGLLLAGCMAEGPFPSLAQRPAEREPIREPERPQPQVPSDSSLRSRISDRVAQARSGQQAFEAAAGSAEAAARAAGAQGSDSWVAAQEQISRLEAARAPTTRALADLDALALERASIATSETDWAELNAALSEVQRLAQAQHEHVDRLKALIAR